MNTTLSTLASAAALVLASSIAHAEVYDLAASFSEAQNPHGVWSYGQSDLGTGFLAYGSTGANGSLRSWTNGASLVLHNISSTAYDVDWAHFLPHTTYFHPGPATDQDATIRFTAPSDGQYTLDAAFWGTDAYYQGTSVSMYLNGTPLGSAIGISGYDPSGSTPFTFLQTFAMNSGDVLDIALDNGGVYYYDATGVRAVITSTTPVPEPGTLALLLAGLGVVARSARRLTAGSGQHLR